MCAIQLTRLRINEAVHRAVETDVGSTSRTKVVFFRPEEAENFSNE